MGSGPREKVCMAERAQLAASPEGWLVLGKGSGFKDGTHHPSSLCLQKEHLSYLRLNTGSDWEKKKEEKKGVFRFLKSWVLCFFVVRLYM